MIRISKGAETGSNQTVPRVPCPFCSGCLFPLQRFSSLGILLDRFGPRVVEAVLLMFATAGAAVFVLSGLIIGRALIGSGYRRNPSPDRSGGPFCVDLPCNGPWRDNQPMGFFVSRSI